MLVACEVSDIIILVCRLLAIAMDFHLPTSGVSFQRQTLFIGVLSSFPQMRIYG